ELIVFSPLVAGSIDRRDLADVPADVGVRFVRSGTTPERRSVPARAVWSGSSNGSGGLVIGQRGRVIGRDGPRTSVRDTTAQPIASLPIDIVAPADVRPAVDAALAAVLAERVLGPVPGRTARVIIAPAGVAGASGGAPSERAERRGNQAASRKAP